MSEVVASTSENGGRYHDPDCASADRTRPENRRQYDSPEAAEQDGYTPCGRCHRSEYRKWREETSFRGRDGADDGQDEKGDDRHGRGIFHQTYLGPGGEEVLVAVDSRDRAVVRTFVPDHANVASVIRLMASLLSAIDPPGWQADKRASERREGLELIH